jgi:hypothetical protein
VTWSRFRTGRRGKKGRRINLLLGIAKKEGQPFNVDKSPDLNGLESRFSEE